MSLLAVAFRNNTASDILIGDLGATIPALTTVDHVQQFTQFELRHSADLTTLITSGDLTVLENGIEVLLTQWLDFQAGAHFGMGNHWISPTSSVDMTISGVVSLNAASGTVTIESGLTTTVDTQITPSGNAITIGNFPIESAGSITIISGSSTVTVSGESSGLGSLPGKTYQISYGNSGVTSNKWLEVGHGNPSNQSPHVLPFASQLIGMTFSNKNDYVDSDIELYTAVSGGGASPLELVLTWEIRDIRTARRTDIIGSGIYFNPGDKMAVYLRNQGQSPSDTVFNCYLQIDTSSAADVATENFPDDFVVP
jgi:hypothetical protein